MSAYTWESFWTDICAEDTSLKSLKAHDTGAAVILRLCDHNYGSSDVMIVLHGHALIEGHIVPRPNTHREKATLSDEAFDQLVEGIEHPREPPAALVNAFRRARALLKGQ